MDIKTERTHTPEGNLVFTITISNPHDAPFGESEKYMMDLLDGCKKSIDSMPESGDKPNKVKDDILNLMHSAKEKAFYRVIDNLKFSIENDFRTRFEGICQEIYNWIYDHQKQPLKFWLQEFDPQRTRYYFDNDRTIESDFSE